ncbi:MAG TPA: 50S ribosomal protein L22 [Candidatus Moranbacteria bacterium]|nr:50S ribosomal protein L22 [Candidatus Moranbacteria bacterium]
MKIRASLNNYRRSGGKVRLITPLIVGLEVDQARLQLQNLSKGAADDLIKLLDSAVANAKNNFNLSEDSLVVNNLVVNKGRVMKRWRPRAHGRAMRILKRSCHIDLILETVETKDLKSKQNKQDKQEKTESDQEKEVVTDKQEEPKSKEVNEEKVKKEESKK